jgi:hypothetical protein
MERMGAISSMVSGGRWVRRGAVFEDWPDPHGHNKPAGSEWDTPADGAEGAERAGTAAPADDRT